MKKKILFRCLSFGKIEETVALNERDAINRIRNRQLNKSGRFEIKDLRPVREVWIKEKSDQKEKEKEK